MSNYRMKLLGEFFGHAAIEIEQIDFAAYSDQELIQSIEVIKLAIAEIKLLEKRDEQ